MPTAEEINQHLHQQIPMTRQMGILVQSFSTEGVIATAPLEVNINHQQSVFGGSIAALGIVTGFVAIWGNLKLRAIPAELVIQHSETDFSKPGLGDMEARSRKISDTALKSFTTSLASVGRARILVTSDIFSGGKLIASNTGTFVAIAKKE
ncbi:MAG: thioesterase domain-containing protein [Planctomycetales bacterium]